MAYAIGWEIGDVRSYTFYGIPVKAVCGCEDGYRFYTLTAEAFGQTIQRDSYDAQWVENEAEEIAGDLAVRVLKDGHATLQAVSA